MGLHKLYIDWIYLVYYIIILKLVYKNLEFINYKLKIYKGYKESK